MRSAGSVPATAIEGQLIETTPGSSDARVSGLLALYTRGTAEVRLGAEDGGVFLPDMAEFGGETRRMVWTDWDHWHWEHLTLPRGVRVAPFQKDVRFGSPVAARGEFGPRGLSGRLTGPIAEPGDAVLATPSGEALAVRFTRGGEFSVGQKDVLAEGEFIPNSLLSDAQVRRQEFYRRLLVTGKNGPYRDRPTLLAWTRPVDLGFVYPEGSERKGEALVSVPLVLERPTGGTRVAVPAPFIDAASVPRPEGWPSSRLFDDRTGEVFERSGNIESWVRFQLPREVLPLDLDGARVTLRVSGGIDGIELLGRKGEAVETIRTWKSPAATLAVAISSRELLTLDDRGGLSLGVRVRSADASADADSSSPRQHWQVESMRVEASGTTREAAGGGPSGEAR